MDGFYELIPIGAHFRDEGVPTNVEKGNTAKFDKANFDLQRDKLLSFFGYTTKRPDGKERILFPKVNFVLNNRFPKDENRAKAALLMLVADRNALFKDIDREYRHRILNRPNRSREAINKNERKKLNELTREYYEDSFETADRFSSYLKRLDDLTILQSEFETYDASGVDSSFKLSELKMKKVLNNRALYDIILERIISYFESIDRDRRQNKSIVVSDKETAIQRLCWCIESVFCECINDGLLPITVLKIVHCGGRDIIRAEADDILGLRFRLWISKNNHYQERVQQLVFLDGLLSDFNYNCMTIQKNLSDYLRVWGPVILSEKEQRLWRRWVEFGISIPAIEFQLLLHDYWKECIPLNLDTLCYSPASKLHLGGFYDIYHSASTAEEIEMYSRQLEADEAFLKHRDLYLQMMGKPISLKEKVGLLCDMDEIQLDHLMMSFRTGGVDADELRRLLRETILRMSLQRKALEKLSQEAKKLWGIRLLGIE